MLPTVVANELKDAVGQFLRQAFPFATPYFQKRETGEPDSYALIDALIEHPGRLFKGPYLDIKLPFRVAKGAELPFRHLNLPFTPYQHQLQAFRRLAGDQPRSTLIATGTGSGKTECFMLPVLDDCLNRREPGIKTIIVYPMNALATDQARRFAEEVSRLDTRLTVGLYVGDQPKGAPKTMGPNYVISDQKTLQEHPPDILLTNYKMLDFLLIRPKDQPLWRFNKPGTLRYLVVDELHTFDGAQGTDLACLVRRLRDRLGAGEELACVGTSATLGTDSAADLLKYAGDIFAAPFDDSAIIGEDRLTPDEYLGMVEDDDGNPSKREPVFFNWPDRHESRMDPGEYEKAEDYLFHQARIWFEDLPAEQVPQLNARDARRRAEAAVRLGELLHQHAAFHELIRACETLQDFSELAAEWRRRLPSAVQAERLLTSLTSLISAARLWNRPESDAPDDWLRPFLQVRQQLWLRELRRLVCSVPDGDGPPRIAFADDLKDLEKPLHLPLLHCRECHLGAWGAVARKGDNRLNPELKTFYQAWFGYSPQATLLVPLDDDEARDEYIQYFCPHCLRLQSGNRGRSCAACHTASLLRVWTPDIRRTAQKGERVQCHHDCPDCGARDSLAVMGYRAATLTSVMTGRLFMTPYNDDFKLIAFSDSVQDAAHRAGFLGANTWRQVVRQAMARWLVAQPPLSLKEMADLLPAYWRDEINNDARYCAVFMPPNLVWHRHYRALADQQRNDLPAGSDLPDMIRKRLAWECIAEFGRRSRVGRSLERAGIAAVGVDGARLVRDTRALGWALREEVGSLREVSDPMFVTFVVGWLHHFRQVGAIYDPCLDTYLYRKGDEYILNRKMPWMPNYGRSQRPPAAITLKHVAANFEAVTLNRGDTWSTHWLNKTLGSENVFASAEAEQIFKLTLDQLTKRGWLVERPMRDQSLWMLDPDRLLVDTDTGAVRCDTCRHSVPVSPRILSLYKGIPCLRSTCRGRLEPGDAPPEHGVYGITDPRRLVPHEHTGLLPRDVRENVERSFMNGGEPWHINLLSATPTLEMGIDIGALSSIFLCSVPPAQANYLQRIGRAGRRDGNALAVTVANGRNHDLFFYQEPRDMIAGRVQTPGVFLKATAVLERQLIAYCFDRWVASGIDASAIPGQLQKVLDAVEHTQRDRFPYNLIDFVENNREAIFEGFIGLFASLKDDREAVDYLASFIRESGEGSLSWRLINRLQDLVNERASLLRKTQQLKARYEELRRQPKDPATDEEIENVQRERNALQSLLSGRNRQQTLNFFTDEGLLPNYAFPEEGVTLQSVILRRRGDEEIGVGEKPYEKESYTFQRPAQAALGELAPESRFYAVSHEMQIEQVELGTTGTEEWRFCDRCQHSERVDLEDRHSACPRCGSAQWADSGQKTTVLRLRQVYSTVDTRYNRIGDESDQRQPLFFNRQMLVDIAGQGGRKGFRLKSDELPFGFEFVNKVTLREINFGPAVEDSRVFSVAGKELSRKGFRLCKHCGKVQKEKFRKFEHAHSYSCPVRRNKELDTDDAYLDSLYLYRELESEAIRILLPLSEVGYSDESLHSFIAALNLGLRIYFKGNVHHLEVTEMREPPAEGRSERIYLVVYDRIPGGTGYLKELMQSPEKLFNVLEYARRRLTQCECVDNEELDGCYRCILAYRDSRNMPTISRKGAAELLGKILALRDQVEAVDTLSGINTNVLVESKLEQKFVEALGRLPDAEMSNTLINGKRGSLLTLPGAEGSPVAWFVEHQVKLGPDQGVALNTAVDVLLTPARARDAECYRPIAVYLDGLQYHHDSVDDDVCKRTALLLSGRYWVYSLNWDDLPEPGQVTRPYDKDLMTVETADDSSMRRMFDGLADKAHWEKAAEHTSRHGRGSLDWLADLLRDPSRAEGLFRQRAVYRAWTALAPAAANNNEVRAAISKRLATIAPAPVCDRLSVSETSRIPGGITQDLGNGLDGLEMIVAIPQAALKSGVPGELVDSLHAHLCFDDRDTGATEEFKAAWRGFWHAANQLQFLPGFTMATREAVSSGTLEKVWSAAQQVQREAERVEAIARDGIAGDWAEVVEYAALAPETVQALHDAGLPVPEVGLDLADDTGRIIIGGERVELCWPDHKVAVIDGRPDANLTGWHMVSMDNIEVDRLKALIAGGDNG